MNYMNYIKDYFKDAKVGDYVVDIISGKIGKIENIEMHSDYPIWVGFDDCLKEYTIDGRFKDTDVMQILFYRWHEPIIKIPELIKIPEQHEKKYEFKYGNQAFQISINDIKSVHGKHLPAVGVKYGRIRKTKETAEQALKLQTRVMRLHALAEQLGGLKEFKFSEENYYIFKKQGTYRYSSANDTDGLTVVWMTEECAKKICEMLNNGKFSLDMEDDKTGERK